ncbi:glutathione S-transferase family protein [Prosthecomicrobium pneumaticum]|uniref:Glutathione S-transferase n=1 Tax=Prosthecomicrobium pneumaticum TaxID=81895 RepID=A0A7W9CT74_9HYPH|nr:glutathione S-transferase N-terminal domain-containing protein [Prosthecomicrobium pneumaticum]MBB5751460.1 glutathione S-transferase [Prosthecomicrobium pneumaticum]
MLVLHSSPASPFGRKVKIAAAFLGLSDRIEVVTADTGNPADPIRQVNPLGKIPALVLEDGSVLFDSRVIVEWLDHEAGGGRIVPAEPAARFAALRLQALADGMTDAALLQVYEGRWREADQRSDAWLGHQRGKVERALAALEASPPGGAVTVGTIALACGLGYLDLRFEGRWRADHPRLVAWLDRFADAVPAFATTRPQT